MTGGVRLTCLNPLPTHLTRYSRGKSSLTVGFLSQSTVSLASAGYGRHAQIWGQYTHTTVSTYDIHCPSPLKALVALPSLTVICGPLIVFRHILERVLIPFDEWVLDCGSVRSEVYPTYGAHSGTPICTGNIGKGGAGLPMARGLGWIGVLRVWQPRHGCHGLATRSRPLRSH